MQQRRPKVVTYDTKRLERDMADRGWLATDLAREAGVADVTVSRFLRGEHQTARVAGKLAAALGFTTPRRYVLRQGHEVPAA